MGHPVEADFRVEMNVDLILVDRHFVVRECLQHAVDALLASMFLSLRQGALDDWLRPTSPGLDAFQYSAHDRESAAAEIQAGLSEERITEDRTEAKELRDRAYTFLDDLVDEIREAGRYAYRNDPKRRVKFTSPYLRRRRQRTRRPVAAEIPPALIARADARNPRDDGGSLLMWRCRGSSALPRVS